MFLLPLPPCHGYMYEGWPSLEDPVYYVGGTGVLLSISIVNFGLRLTGG